MVVTVQMTSPAAVLIEAGVAALHTDGSTANIEDTKQVLRKASVVLLYFSAHWCGPCKQFTPILRSFYEKFHKSAGIEIVFVSFDHSERTFADYYTRHMPWSAVMFNDKEDGGGALAAKFSVNSIPRLVGLRANGSVMTSNLMEEVRAAERTGEYPASWR